MTNSPFCPLWWESSVVYPPVTLVCWAFCCKLYFLLSDHSLISMILKLHSESYFLTHPDRRLIVTYHIHWIVWKRTCHTLEFLRKCVLIWRTLGCFAWIMNRINDPSETQRLQGSEEPADISVELVQEKQYLNNCQLLSCQEYWWWASLANMDNMSPFYTPSPSTLIDR